MAFVFYCSPFSNNLTVDAPYRHSNIDSATELLSAVSLCSLCSSRSSNLQTAQVPVKLSIEANRSPPAHHLYSPPDQPTVYDEEYDDYLQAVYEEA